MTEFLNEDGGFTEDFKTALPSMLGEEHAESKVFEDITGLSMLAKAYADTKSMVGKKLEGVIQKPTDNSSDDDKANFRKTLLTELGAPESVDGYQFDRPDMPDGMEYDEGMEGDFKSLLHQANCPLDIAKTLVDGFNKLQIGRFNQGVEADNAEFEKESTSMKTDWAGEALPTNLRIALKAVKEFVGDDLKKQIDEAKLYDKATDLSVWRKLGFSPSQIRVWHNIASKVMPSTAGKDEGGQTGVKSTLYPNTKFE